MKEGEYKVEVKCVVVIHGDGEIIKEVGFDHEPNNSEIKECLSEYGIYQYYCYATVEKRFYKE